MTSQVCHKLRPSADHVYDGKQGFSYFEGIARESVGAQGICMHLLTIPPGGRAKAHLHEAHETTIYMLEGAADMYWGHTLEHHMHMTAGEMLYIPAGMPHLPFNSSDKPARVVIARTDAHEQESVVLLPHLEAAARRHPAFSGHNHSGVIKNWLNRYRRVTRLLHRAR